jgi:carbonic anhydrase
MKYLKHLFENNIKWSESLKGDNPLFFKDLAIEQNPEYLWIGCSDSRVTANEIVGLAPGELFVHRNVANIVIHTDLNCLSVIQYAIEILQVKHIIVCGHYGCGGIKHALGNERIGLLDNWLLALKEIHYCHRSQFEKLEKDRDKENLLSELNVLEQVRNVSRTSVVRDAWERGQNVIIHGWMYDIYTGLMKDMNLTVDSNNPVMSWMD